MSDKQPQVLPAPNVIVRPTLLERTKVKVGDEGDLVYITIGNSTIKMRYADAIQLSQMLRVHAKKAKRFAGDNGRHWSVLGVLDGHKG